MTPNRIIEAAAILEALRLTPTHRLDRLPLACRPQTETEAYAVNDALQRRFGAAGMGEVCGYKLGCTTPLMQQRIGLDHPTAGCIRTTQVFHGELAISHEAARGLGCENEICVRLGKDVPLADDWTAESITPYVDTVMGSIELVEQRYVILDDVRKAHIQTIIADDFWHWGAILSQPVPRWRDLDLANNRARTLLDGVSQGEGIGEAALGHPLKAVAWLANHLAGRGRSLMAGMIVQTGSLVAPARPAPGQTVICDHGVLGAATLRWLA